MTLVRLTSTTVLAASLAIAAAAQTPARDFETLLAQAMTLHQAGDLIGAIDAYEAALRLNPSRADARSNLAAALVRLGKFEEAVAQYRQALESAPQDPAIRFNLALAYYKAARFSDAVPLLESLAAAPGAPPAAVLLLSEVLLQQGEYQRVIEQLEPREAAFGEDLAFGYLLGTALVRTGQRERGQVYIDRIFKSGDSAEGRLLMGTALLHSRDYQAALVELRKAVELNAALPSARTLYGRALLGVGDTDAAAREFQRALQANPNDFEANLQLGGLRKRDQRNADALLYLQRALDLRPHDAGAQFAVASVLLPLGRADEARALLEEVVGKEPEFTEAHVLLATSYYRLKRQQDGDRHRAIADRLRLERQDREPKGSDLSVAGQEVPAAPQPE